MYPLFFSIARTTSLHKLTLRVLLTPLNWSTNLNLLRGVSACGNSSARRLVQLVENGRALRSVTGGARGVNWIGYVNLPKLLISQTRGYSLAKFCPLDLVKGFTHIYSAPWVCFAFIRIYPHLIDILLFHLSGPVPTVGPLINPSISKHSCKSQKSKIDCVAIEMKP